MAASKYLEDKYRIFFRFLDVNRDCDITQEDFKVVLEKILRTYTAGDTHRIEIRNGMKKWWAHFEPMLTNGKVDEDIFVKTVKKHYEENLSQLRHDNIVGGKLLFSIMDRNKDNLISEEEFQLYYSVHNVKNKKVVSNIFKQLDIDEDGYLTLEECTLAMVNYFTCNDPLVGYAFMYDVFD